MKKLFFILLLMLGAGMATDYYSQTGGRKREGKAKKRGNFVLTQYKSRGHADEFARGSSGRRGRFARLFGKKHSSWTYKSSGSRRSHYKANQFLFTRNRSKGKIENADYQFKQGRDRSKHREQGNKTFKRKKYGRR